MVIRLHHYYCAHSLLDVASGDIQLFFFSQTESQIFPPTTGGAEKMALDMKIPFLGRVPLDPRIGKCCDEGKSFLSEIPDSPAAKAYQTIIQSK